MAKTSKTAKEVAQETVDAVKGASEQTKAVVSEKVAGAKKAVKKTVEKNPAVSEAVKETKGAVDKAVEDAKATAKKTAKRATATAKKVSRTTPTEVFVQYQNREISQSDIVDRVVAAFTADGRKKSAIKSLMLYIKPEDNAAYYVINETESGKVDL